eukprot:1160515-Pelagomonas_calceolata.AAC.9
MKPRGDFVFLETRTRLLKRWRVCSSSGDLGQAVMYPELSPQAMDAWQGMHSSNDSCRVGFRAWTLSRRMHGMQQGACVWRDSLLVESGEERVHHLLVDLSKSVVYNLWQRVGSQVLQKKSIAAQSLHQSSGISARRHGTCEAFSKARGMSHCKAASLSPLQ